MSMVARILVLAELALAAACFALGLYTSAIIASGAIVVLCADEIVTAIKGLKL